MFIALVWWFSKC